MRNKLLSVKNTIIFQDLFLTTKSYFQTNTIKPIKISPPPIIIFGVTGSFSKVNDSKSVIKILPLSIEATYETSPIWIAL